MSILSKRSLDILKKSLAVLTVTATVLSLSGFALVLNATAAAPGDYGLKEGDVVSATGSSDPDVYIVNEHGFKRLFLNPVIFGFYGHLGGFSKVKTVSASTRDAFVTSGLFRNCESGDQKVWAVEVNGEDTGVLHHVNIDGATAVSQDANFFKKVFCINNTEANWYPKSSVAYTSLSQVPVYTRVPGATPVVTGSVSASLAADSPVSGTLVKSQAAADLAHFMFSGSGAVTSLKLKRLGVSADTDLSNVYLYDGVKRLTDAASVTNGEISFNDSTGLFMVNGSKVISVRADLSSNSGETVGVQLISVNGNGTSVSGNLFTVANADLATVALSSSTTPAINSALDPNSDVVVWQNTATVGTRYVWLKSLQYRVIGSVVVGDLQNFRLYIDGVMAGSAVSSTDANGYVVFDLSGSPVKMETGGRVLKVVANVVGGSSKNFTMSLRQAPDLFTVDSQYSQPVKATASGNFPVSAGLQTITSGTLTINKATDSPAGDIVKGASGVVLGKFEFKANGEKMKVENLRASFTSSNGGTTTASNVGQLRNGAIFADGVQIGSTQSLNEDSWTTAYTEFSLGSSLIIEPGKPRMIEVRADMYDADGTDNVTANDTLTVNIAAGSSNVQQLTSLGYISNSAKSANQLTVKTGSLTASKYSGYANQSVVSPSNGVKVGHFTLAQSSSEDINVNTINFDQDNSSGTFTGADLTDMYIKIWNDTGSLIYTSPVKATISDSASNSYSVNFSLPKNKTYQVEAWANVASGITAADSMNLEMDATGVTTGSSTSSSTSAVDGQTITARAGSLTVSNGSLSVAALRNGGTTANAYQFTIQPSYDDFTLDEVYVDLSSTVASSTGAVATLWLKEGSTIIGSATVNPSTGSASFTGLSRLMRQSDGTKTFNIDVQFANVGVGSNDTYGTVVARLDGLKYRDSAGSITTTTGLSTTTYTGNDNRVVKAYPSFSNVALDASPLAAGENVLFRTAVTGNGGNVALKTLVFAVTTTSGPTFSASEATWKLFVDGTDVSSLATITSASAVDLTVAGAHTGYVAFTFNNEYVISSAKTLELRGFLSAIGSNYQAVSVQIANPKTSASAPDDASTVAGSLSSTSASVVWSDMSAVGHSTSTDDWFNDYLLKTIGASQTKAISQ
jgi:hypothetical protein